MLCGAVGVDAGGKLWAAAAIRALGQPTTSAPYFLLSYDGTNWAKANASFTRQMTELLAVPGADTMWGLGSSSLGNPVTDTNA